MSFATAPEVPTMIELTTDEMADAAGISYRQADYWCRLGHLSAIGPTLPGSGNYRRFASDQVCRARFVSCLMAPGPRHVSDALPRALARMDELDDWTGIMFVNGFTGELARRVAGGTPGWLVVDLDWCADVADDVERVIAKRVLAYTAS